MWGLLTLAVAGFLLLGVKRRDLRLALLALPWLFLTTMASVPQEADQPWVPAALAVSVLAALWAAKSISHDLECEARRAKALHDEHVRLTEDASSRLEISATRFRDLVRIFPAGVFETDAEGNLSYVSSRFRQIVGRGRSELLSQGWLDLVHPDDRVRVAAKWRAACEERHPLDLEFRVDSEGQQRWVHLEATPKEQPAQASRALGLVGVLSDVTGRHHEARKRVELENRIRRREKYASLCMFAGGVADDFNNLLQGVVGNIEELKGSIESEARRAEVVESIEASALEAIGLARKMMTFAGRRASAPQVHDWGALIEQSLPMIVAEIDERIEVRFDRPARHALVEVDPEPIQQSLIELAVNAAEAYGDGVGVIQIRLEHLRLERERLLAAHGGGELEAGEYIMLEVSDRGAGIAEETRELVLDPFLTTKFAGRGLGMAVALGTVRSHRGALEVETESGRGTAVRLFLPAIHEDREQEPGPSPARPGARILVVDDQQIVRKTARLMLEGGGYRVETASGGEEALEMLAKEVAPFDLVLLDISMPDLNGWTTLARILELRPQIAVIMSSGYPEDEPDPRQHPRGHVAFIQKPYRSQELNMLIERALAVKTIS